jgi:DNA-binding response OmpR family regulator
VKAKIESENSRIKVQSVPHLKEIINKSLIIISISMKNKILVIDDEPSIRLLLENFLSHEYEIVSKSDGYEALEWLESNLPELIICDIHMPNMDGYQLIENVRKRGFTKHTPIIMLSGNESSKERVKCYKLGAQDYLTKPFNPEELEELIRKNLYPIHYAVNW